MMRYLLFSSRSTLAAPAHAPSRTLQLRVYVLRPHCAALVAATVDMNVIIAAGPSGRSPPARDIIALRSSRLGAICCLLLRPIPSLPVPARVDPSQSQLHWHSIE